MMKKTLNNIKKYKFAIITASIILLVGIIILYFLIPNAKKASIKTLDENGYYLSYDDTWKVTEKKENYVSLEHQSDSKITIELSTLTDEYRYMTVDELIDELVYNIQKQNPDYKLITKKQDKITKYEFKGYKLLYENSSEQVMIDIYKKGDKLIFIRYEADNDYFDILLDSVQSIIYNLNIKDEKIDLKNSLKLDLTNINYDKSDELDSSITDSKTYEIAKNNYYVEYVIPANFNLNSIDSSSGNFNLKLDSGRINMSVNIWNRNIYEYLDKNETYGVYSNYKNNQKYPDFQETLTKLDSDYDSYIYKNSYYVSNGTLNQTEQRKDENAELIYALNNSHILVITIRSTGVPITEKLISQIKVNSSKNYASYVKVEKDNDYLLGTLQRFNDKDAQKIDYITLRVPDKYEEIDENNNIYTSRYYSLNYNEDMLIYDYDVHYGLTNLSIESILKNVYISSANGEAHELTYSGDLTLNDKVFEVYDGGYTALSGIILTNINRQKYYVNKKVLVYEIPDKGRLYIEISGNGKDISDDMLNELTNFTVEEKERGN